MMEKKYQFILLFFLFIILAALSFLASPFFDIREFAIHSRSEIDKASLRPYLNDYYGENILLTTQSELEKNLLKHRLVSSFTIEKSFPSKIHIIIEERKPAAWIANNGKKLVFSADGIILEQLKLDSNLKIPQLEGFEYLFSEKKMVFPEAMDNLLTVLNKLDQKFIGQIKKINYQNNILKLFMHNNLAVNMGSAENLEEKFTLLSSIITKLKDENKQGDYINLKVLKHPVVKLKENNQ